jgi:hypothetical protein
MYSIPYRTGWFQVRVRLWKTAGGRGEGWAQKDHPKKKPKPKKYNRKNRSKGSKAIEKKKNKAKKLK